jgi:hypothetical protein
MPIYFAWFTTALLSVGGDADDQNLPQSGRPLYCVRRGFLNTYLRELPVPWAKPSFRLRLTRTRQSARQCDSEELQASVQHLFEEFQNSLWDRLENHNDVHVRDADEQLAG